MEKLVLIYVFYIIISGISAMVIHEGGHFVMTYILTGIFVKFTFNMAKMFNVIPVPRYVWKIPDGVTENQKKAIAIFGFGSEILAIPIFIYFIPPLALVYSTIVALHFIAYPFYCGFANDFRSLT